MQTTHVNTRRVRPLPLHGASRYREVLIVPTHMHVLVMHCTFVTCDIVLTHPYQNLHFVHCNLYKCRIVPYRQHHARPHVSGWCTALEPSDYHQEMPLWD